MRLRMQPALLFVLVFCPLAMAQQAAAPPAAGKLVSAHAPYLAPARPVARVNGAVLTDRDLLREMYTIFPYAKQHNGGLPKSMEAEIRQGALKMIEFEELVYQEATRRQMSIAPGRLAASEKQFRERFETKQEYEYFLKAEAGGSEQALAAKIKRSLLIEDFLKKEIENKSVIGAAEAKAFYAQNPDRFKVPETYALQTISVLPPPAPNRNQPAPPVTAEISRQMRARAESSLKQAKATKSYEEFGALAEKISEDDYRVMMGDHRAVKVAEVPAEILAVLSKLQPGQVSDLVQVQGAYTIVRLNAHNPERMQKFEEAAPVLREQMQRHKTERLRHELDARLRKNAKIEEL